MNPYDKVHELARSIRESEAFQKAAKAKLAMESDAATLQMATDFKRRQFQMQAKQMMGQSLSEEDLTQLQRLGDVVELNQDVRAYLQADMELQVLFMDVQRILGEVQNEVSILSLEELYEEMGQMK